MNYICPVCGYEKLDTPPNNFTICPSCGTEFGYDDFEYSLEDLTRAWVDSGMQWWSRTIHAPKGWNPAKQLKNIQSLTSVDSATFESHKIGLEGELIDFQESSFVKIFTGNLFDAENLSSPSSSSNSLVMIPA